MACSNVTQGHVHRVLYIIGLGSEIYRILTDSLDISDVTKNESKLAFIINYLHRGKIEHECKNFQYR